MVIAREQGLLINVTTYLFMFTAYFYLLKRLKPIRYWQIIAGTLVIQVLDLINLIRYEELVLVLLLVVMMLPQLWKTQNKAKLSGQMLIAGTLAYLTTMVAALITELAIMGWLQFFDQRFSWLTTVFCVIILPILGSLMLLVAFKLRTILNEAIQRYGYRDLLFVLGGLLGSTIMVIVLVDEFAHLQVPASYLTLMIGTIFVALLFVIIGCWLFMRLLLRQAKLEREQNNQKNLAMYTEQLEQNYNEVRQFRHDIKNALLALEIRINESDDPVLVDDIHVLMQQYHFEPIFTNEIGRFANINNPYIKGIIFSKYMRAQKLGIAFSVSVVNDLFDQEQQYFNELRILGILLDNAIEATIPVNQAQISVSIFKETNRLTYVIKNQVQAPVNIAKIWQRGYSTKGENRGLGLVTVREIVNQHDNFYLSLKQVDHTFVVQLSVEA